MMMQIVLSFFLLILIPSASARSEFTTNSKTAALTQLPLCIDDPKTLENIEQILDVNKPNKEDSKAVKKSKQNRRYDGYKNALANSSDMELFMRLAYAETLAANCPEQNTQIATRIVNVIGNRVQKRNGDIKSVVFQPAQFASSLHNYETAKYKDFLCPKDEALWKDISTQVQNFIAKGTGELSSDTINYFLYKHDKRWAKEPWDYKENRTGAAESVRVCIKTFHVPNWK